MIRHTRTDYNEVHKQDSLGKAVLSALGEKQAKQLASRIKKSTKKDVTHIYISPSQRCLFTILLYLKSRYTEEELQTIQRKYEEVRKIFKDLRDKDELISYIKKSDTKKTFELIPQVCVDFRLTEYILPEMQDQVFDCSLITSIPMDERLYPKSESLNDLKERTENFLHEVNTRHKTETIIIVAHAEPITMMKNIFKPFDYISKRDDYYAHNKTIETYKPQIRYRDNDRNKEIDLHKPYVDNYRFKKGNKEYRRIPEVMDCRFES